MNMVENTVPVPHATQVGAAGAESEHAEIIGTSPTVVIAGCRHVASRHSARKIIALWHTHNFTNT